LFKLAAIFLNCLEIPLIYEITKKEREDEGGETGGEELTILLYMRDLILCKIVVKISSAG